MADKKPEIAIFELIKPSSTSGFIRKGTERDAVPDEIKYPKWRGIVNRSVMYEYSEEHKAEIPVKTRYISGVPIIKEEDQVKRGFIPNYKEDLIGFINGYMTVTNYGSHVGLYSFMMNHARNESNPNRPKDQKFKPLFRQLKLDEKAKETFNLDFAIGEALMYVKGLTSKQGSEYVFAEERIDLLCRELGVAAEHYSEKITALNAFAKTMPIQFLDKAKKSEQTVLVEIEHAIKLKVIAFEGNTAMYVKNPEKIKAFTGNMGEEKKMTALGAWFKSVDGKDAYEKFKVELQAAVDERNAQQ
jgi:hypothetical protein